MKRAQGTKLRGAEQNISNIQEEFARCGRSGALMGGWGGSPGARIPGLRTPARLVLGVHETWAFCVWGGVVRLR